MKLFSDVGAGKFYFYNSLAARWFVFDEIVHSFQRAFDCKIKGGKNLGLLFL